MSYLSIKGYFQFRLSYYICLFTCKSTSLVTTYVPRYLGKYIHIGGPPNLPTVRHPESEINMQVPKQPFQ